MSERLNLLAPEVRDNPHPYFAKLRRESPVCQVEPNGIWVVSRYDDIIEAYKNTKALSSAGMRAATEPPWLGRYNPLSDSLLMLDPPAHTRLRGLVTRAFTATMLSRVESYTRDVTERLLSEMLMRFHEQKVPHVDFVSTFSMRVPAITMALLMGLNPDHAPQLKRWVDDMADVSSTQPEDTARLARIRTSLDEMEHYFQGMIDQRRQTPGDDLVSDLLAARLDGEALTNKEIMSFLCVLLVAGVETTTNLLSHLALRLAHEPAWMDRMRHNEVLMTRFIEELLRCDPPVQLTLRLATEDLKIGGVVVPAHSIVAMLIASGLRDETQFPEPDRFDPERGIQANLAFGYGIHYCIGAPLARMETRVVLDVLLSMCSRLELHTDKVKWNQALLARGPAELPVHLSPL